ncbi:MULTISPECIES: 4-oxalocrotonate tautomerase [Sphingomonadaceae]|uniref:4-oxalocrotonate tautomerase n=1 Tax=Rhizorhabdus wittichii TaxID=160791 RepID=A0A975DAX5_9SPHN|nr:MULTISPECIES: 4-oxalocrotonate tautomerase [Sphingomonadaceae]QTH24790.1 4-oxalocrotonate tautomerase [Rhizorhabdus wittichii]QUM74465.1 4-oxalocrotonate tautomerase [Sphingopyxis granuli]
MPIVEFHLTEGRQSDDDIGALLEQSTDFYVRTLYPAVDPLPLDRVRAFVSLHRPQHWATAGVLASDGGADAPYFTCLALAGRPQEQLHALLRGFTDLIVMHCSCERRHVRGQVISIAPENWCIAGEPASMVRAGETERRAQGS